jgi:hypothetical protein
MSLEATLLCIFQFSTVNNTISADMLTAKAGAKLDTSSVLENDPEALCRNKDSEGTWHSNLTCLVYCRTIQGPWEI